MTSEDGGPGGQGPEDRVLAELLEEFTRRLRRGESPSVDEYLAREPALASRIRKIFPAICFLEKACPSSETEPTDQPRPSSPEKGQTALLRLGDFRIVREIGRGGMGIVYEAEQQSLGRRVALKLLPFQLLRDPRHLDRFVREARAAATLQHPNIVPVYGVGEEGGHHYYAMQYVEGEGLDKVIAEVKRAREDEALKDQPAGREEARGPTHALATEVLLGAASGAGRATGLQYFTAVACLGAQAADALSYAHNQGILHRDIKPSNLLLDLRGTLWVTDFGLAKSQGSEDLTRSGELVGTLPYMAPERFQGWADPRSDVYSLGLVLYELLTLEPAFGDTDRSRLMKMVIEEEPRRPRRLAPLIPRDLEIIVLKAMSKEPGNRYSTAGAMADDLRRFIAKEPILAHSSGILHRSAKWARRRPAAAGLLVVTFLAAVTVLAGSLWYNARLQREGARTRANLQRALGAADSMLTWVGDEGLSMVPQIEPVRRGLLEEALRFHEDFLRDEKTDPILRLGAARACARIGQIYGLLGQRSEAMKAIRRSIALLDDLAREEPTNESYRGELQAARTTASLLESAALPPRGAEVSRFPIEGSSNVVDVKAADIDGDAKLDLIAANRLSNSVTVLRGAGSRSFVPVGTFATGLGPYQVLAHDLDADGRQDVVTLDQASRTISVLFNAGGGALEAPVSHKLGFEPWSMVSADLDGDGSAEVVAAGGTRDLVSLHLTPGREASLDAISGAGDYPTSLATGDFDGDGSLDIIAGCTPSRRGSLSILWNDGKGTFSPGSNFFPGVLPGSLFSGDVDRDGDIDLVAVDTINGAVSVVLNRGSRSFEQGTKFAFGPLAMSVGLVDLSGRGSLDLIVSNEIDGVVSILRGDGRGAFPDVLRFQSGGNAFRGCVADLDGDDRLDVILANGLASDVAVLFHVKELLDLPERLTGTAGE